MSNVTQDRYRQANRSAWDTLLTRWIATLPDRWEGPVLALEFALESVRVTHSDLRLVHIPSGTAMGRRVSQSEPLLARQGWRVRIKRSRKTGRTLVFEKVKAE
jgi:hypothetical protein